MGTIKKKNLFRGFDPYTGEWVFGDLVHICDKVYIRPTDGEVIYPIREKTDGQCTEVEDFDKKYIFEGDLLLPFATSGEIGKISEGEFYEVVFIEGAFKLVNKVIKMALLSETIKWFEMRIVGNAHSKPLRAKITCSITL